jgi:hypothetical protein
MVRLGMDAIIRKNGSLFNRYCFDVPRSPARNKGLCRRVSKGLFAQQPQANDSIDVKVGTFLARPVYVLRRLSG